MVKADTKTSDILKKVGASPWAKLTHLMAGADPNEVEQLRHITHHFCREFAIEVVEREFFGYFVVKENSREILGVHPISLREFFLFAIYCSIIIFQKPSLSKTIEFLDYLSDYYDLNPQLWGDILGEMMELVYTVDGL